MNLESSVTEIKGIGTKTEKLLNSVGVYRLRDMLLYFPRAYVYYPDPITKISEDTRQGEDIAIKVIVKKAAVTRHTRKLDITLATAFVGDVAIECIWFRMAYVSSILKPGEHILYGKLINEKGKYKMQVPLIYSLENYAKIAHTLRPIYPLTKGVTNNLITKTITSVLDAKVSFKESLPDFLVKKYQFLSPDEAIRTIHFPNSLEALETARRRFAYEEFFYFLLGQSVSSDSKAKIDNIWNFNTDESYDLVEDTLGFSLTDDQKNVVNDIKRDLRSGYISHRLIQGDVGSGKTVVAFMAMLDAAFNGYQSLIMAPTEVLASQHRDSLIDLLKRTGLENDYEVILLTGSTKLSEKKKIYETLKTKSNVLIIGTHALIQEKVEYKNLAVAIVDEQHRFGVNQRLKVVSGDNRPHLLVMSATPIPRTLAMILYSNMSLSMIRQMPAGRLPIKTAVIKEDKIAAAYKKIESEVKAGHQAYVICPLVEASEVTDAENVSDYADKIKSAISNDIRIEVMHGKLSATAKNKIMDAYANHEIDVLVSTTVIEVGINVSNATVILIENANRFGLAQLHQLRGRIGRGDAQSFCILVDRSDSEEISKRLKVMHDSTDGFYIAEEDLKLRGPGDVMGVRQSGDLEFKVADIVSDAALLKEASLDVASIVSEDDFEAKYPETMNRLSMIDNRYSSIL